MGQSLTRTYRSTGFTPPPRLYGTSSRAPLTKTSSDERHHTSRVSPVISQICGATIARRGRGRRPQAQRARRRCRCPRCPGWSAAAIRLGGGPAPWPGWRAPRSRTVAPPAASSGACVVSSHPVATPQRRWRRAPPAGRKGRRVPLSTAAKGRPAAPPERALSCAEVVL